MAVEFPFRYVEIKGLGKLFYPMVKVNLKTVSGWREFEFLVDTGADMTTVPLHLLPVLGIEKSSLKSNTILGVGGVKIQTWEFEMPLQIEKVELKVRASAVTGSSIPMLLGRKDILEERFNLLLDSKKKVTVITENK